MEELMKTNSLRSSCGVEESERVKEKILVRSLDSVGGYRLPGLEEGRTCRLAGITSCHAEYHLLNLKTNKVHRHYAPSLLQYALPSSMVVVDNFIYVFGGTLPRSESESQELNSLQPLYHKEVFFGGACLHLSFDQSKTEEEWYPAPVPVPAGNRAYPRCTTLNDKIYAFGDVYLAPQVLDPAEPATAHWKQLHPPPHLVGCTISAYAIPDPSNGRVLMLLSDGQLPSPSIYAFRLTDDSTGGDWRECITVDAQDWTHVAAVVDNVIYFHSRKFPSSLCAFDLANGAWLKIHWKTRFDDGLDMNEERKHFDAIFPLGNKILCLALWTPIYDSPCFADIDVKTKIIVRKFRVEQSGATVDLVPLPTHSFMLPATCQVYEFLPV